MSLREDLANKAAHGSWIRFRLTRLLFKIWPAPKEPEPEIKVMKGISLPTITPEAEALRLELLTISSGGAGMRSVAEYLLAREAPLKERIAGLETVVAYQDTQIAEAVAANTGLQAQNVDLSRLLREAHSRLTSGVAVAAAAT